MRAFETDVAKPCFRIVGSLLSRSSMLTTVAIAAKYAIGEMVEKGARPRPPMVRGKHILLLARRSRALASRVLASTLGGVSTFSTEENMKSSKDFAMFSKRCG